nr:unnamed protein product [Spirometra erinaceieuropaei]
MMAMIELNIDNDENNKVPEALLVSFTASASLLVVVHITALLIKLDSEQFYADSKVCIISASRTLKAAVNVKHITRLLQSFEVAEISGDAISSPWRNVLTIITDVVQKLDCENRLVYLSKHQPIRYGRICLATGGVPRAFLPGNPLVVTLRDTESVVRFRSRLADARRVLLVGNGGIATEVAYEIEDCQVVWVVKHENISVPFLDTAAAYFLLQSRKSVAGAIGFVFRRDDCSLDVDRYSSSFSMQSVPAKKLVSLKCYFGIQDFGLEPSLCDRNDIRLRICYPYFQLIKLMKQTLSICIKKAELRPGRFPNDSWAEVAGYFARVFGSIVLFRVYCCLIGLDVSVLSVVFSDRFVR